MARRIDFYDDPSAPAASSLVPSVNVVVTNAADDVLLIRRTDNQNWAVPGGAIDLGESMVRAAIRETREETGIDCEITGLVGIYTDPKHVILYTSDGEVRQEFSIVLTARATGGTPTCSDESSEVRWVLRDEVDSYPMDRSMRLRIGHFLADRRRPYLGLPGCGLIGSQHGTFGMMTSAGAAPALRVTWRNEMTDAISAAEHADRRARLSEHVRTLGAAGYVVCEPAYITYFTGFRFLSTERPTIYLQNAAGDDVIFVAEFELERTRAEADFERIETYPEYPGLEHPMRILARVAADLGLRGTIAADHDGYPGILGYLGPKLSEVTGAEVIDIAPQIEAMLARKSPAEVELLRESGRWCSRAHRLLQEYSVPGSTEAEASLRAQSEATLAMLAECGPGGRLGSGDGVKAGYRGQIGHRSAWAHAVAHNIGFEPGQVLVSETGAPVWGYHAELERAMVIGGPTSRMRWLFDHMMGARKAAFDAIVPGATSASVDGAVNAYFEKHGLTSYWRQHVGHGTGLRVHEAPFIDVGNPAPLLPGMVFTVEPGLYDSEVGGFRHSDTVAVTEDGYDLLTDYPDDLESLVIPANG